MTHALVTGGAGFIGSNLVDRLLADGYTVTVIDDFATGYKHNLSHVEKDITLVEGSIARAEDLARALEGVEVVFHQAAVPSVPRSVNDPITTHASISTGTMLLLQMCRERGIKRVVQASSSSIYGNAQTLPVVEDFKPGPKSPYAVAKMSAEYYGRVFSDLFDMEVVALRYFNVFGPRQDPTSTYAAVIPLFFNALQKGESPTITGDGDQSRDFCFVENVVHANLLASKAKNAAGKVYNISGGERVYLPDLVKRMNQVAGTDIPHKLLEARPGDIRHSFADLGAAKADLGYSIQVSLDEGLAKTLAWMTSQPQ